MADRKFAANKITLVLLYAFLEWILILMLLLHSIFSYLIFRFADYFGLKKPCILCSWIGPLFGRPDACHGDLVCDHHAAEIDRLGYCSAHRKLADSQNLCLDCSPSKITFSLLPRKDENCQEGSSRCSCCQVETDGGFWGASLRENELNLISQTPRHADDPHIDEKGILLVTGRDGISSMIQQPLYSYGEASFRDLVEAGSLSLNAESKSTQLIRDLYSDENVVEFTFIEDEPIFIQNLQNDCRVSVDESRDGYQVIGDSNHDGLVSETDPLIDRSDCFLGHDTCAVSLGESKGETKFATLIKHKKINDDESYSIAYTAEGDLVMDLCRNLASTKSAITGSGGADAIQQIQAATELERDELSHLARSEILGSNNIEKAERVELDLEERAHEKSNDISTQSCLLYTTIEHVHAQVPHPVLLSFPSWTEELVCEHIEETSTPVSVDLPSPHREEQTAEVVPSASQKSLLPNVEELSQVQVKVDQEQAPPLSLPLAAEDQSVNPVDFSQIDVHGSNQVEEIMDLNELNSVETTEHPLTIGLIKNEEDKLPDTPSSIDGAHNLYRSWMLLEKKESTKEESLDGSIISDSECVEGILTIDKLKTALKVERKALHALYSELEEERNASAVAASQTMAMINRLQEEKASVQMEALQYQRMMEEQSEYDQEALQLLNDLMVKREKEKQELEKELEIYRKKVIEYETKELLAMSNRKRESLRSDSSSICCTNAEDSDDTSTDLKQATKENGNHNTLVDDILNVEESLSHFEEERLSILEQLKVLQEKLFTFDDGNDDFSGSQDYRWDANGPENGFDNDVKGDYHQERRIMVPKGKMLLPLFDATIDGNEYGGVRDCENVLDFTSYPHSSSSISEQDNKNIYIDEEVDHICERLQALEADRDFLRHCFSSMKKGDKGLVLLQEILQHLRNLRSVELYRK